MFSITKRFEFCYGHRVWTQELDSRMALTSHCKCRHVHGHEGGVVVRLSSEEVDSSGMVMDFSHLAWLKQLIDRVIDHRLILDRSDPFLLFLKRGVAARCYCEFDGVFTDFDGDDEIEEATCGLATGWRIPPALDAQFGAAERAMLDEVIGGVTVVDFVPTSEHLARFFYELINKRLDQFFVGREAERPLVEEVTFYETPKTSATYRPHGGGG